MTIKRKNINKGAALLSIVFTLLFFMLLTRFVFIQWSGEAGGEVLAIKAEEKYKRQRTIEARRGSIYDRNGEVIAEDIPSYTIAAVIDESLTTDEDDPNHVVDPRDTAEKLAPLIGMNVHEMVGILELDRKQVEFGRYGRNISHQLKKEIEELKLPGITFIRDEKRYYPNGVFASSVVGYTVKEEIEDDTQIRKQTVGMLGLEQFLNEYLHDEDGYITYEGDQQGFRLPNKETKIVPPENGNDVYLTIDRKIQSFLEDAMNKVNEEYTPEKIIGVIANAKTGEILAMSTRPSFDPNVRDIENYLNDAISYPYEPGSTMKIFTLAAAIDGGVYDGEEDFKSGSYSVPGSKPINDINTSWGVIDFNEAVRRSSNVGFAILAYEKLGPDKFYEYLQAFHFDQPTGIDLPGEVAGSILFNYPIEQVTTAFGQGTTVTPIQLVQAATAITNGGEMLQPYIIDRIVDSSTNEVIEQGESKVVGKPVSNNTSEEVLDLLEQVVVGEHGTGAAYDIDGYQVAGKTGTAEIPNPKGGGYLEGHGNYIFSFLGMAPKEDPELIMYVSVKMPNIAPDEKGSAPVSKIFNPVMESSLKYLNILPTEVEDEQNNLQNTAVTIKSYIGKSAQEAVDSLQKSDLSPILVGNGEKIIAQYPNSQIEVIANEKVILVTDGELLMPDMKGWSLRDVLKVVELLELQPNIVGSGYVTKQNIFPHSVVQKGDLLIIDLQQPAVTAELENESSMDGEDADLEQGEEEETIEVLD
ncbi:penicillin-binding protein [Cytobacillus sp. IB215665]|uniref:penicillin-binding protein n=1 Tax=Cytobacillus sp. IB215665 TaxID=3097357 RepID=UPI002A1355B9|nr:penicillin-binding protein [Cytobacillus sp. IB215665]MDX8364966.1 penicillin-binding protein [Cytobacillus sp. IB215665]